MVLLSTPEKLEAVVDLDTVQDRAGVCEQVWDAFQVDAGTVGNLRVLAVFPAYQIKQITEGCNKLISAEVLVDPAATPPVLAGPAQKAPLTSAEGIQV